MLAESLSRSALLIGLAAFPALATAHDFFGPPQPSDGSQCTIHFQVVDNDVRNELTQWEKVNCSPFFGKNISAQQRCYAQLSQIRQNYSQQRQEGMRACFARAQQVQLAEETRRRNEANSQQIQRQLDQQRQADSQRAVAAQQAARSSDQARREQKTAAISAALGYLFDRVVQDKVEESSPVSISTASVSRNEAVEKRNALAFQEFNRTRKNLKTNRVIKEFQNFAWDRLQAQIDVANQQLAVLSAAVDAIIEPTVQDATSATTQVSIRTLHPQHSFRYQGPLDSSNRPSGVGRITAGPDDAVPFEGVATFVAGQMQGPAVLSQNNDTSRVLVSFESGAPKGPGRLIYKGKEGPVTTEGYFGDVAMPLRIRRGTEIIYEGTGRLSVTHTSVDGKFYRSIGPTLMGPGKRVYENGTVLYGAFSDDLVQGPAIFKSPDGYTRRCYAARGFCFGTTEVTGPDDFYAFGTQEQGRFEGQLLEASSKYIYTGGVKAGRYHGVARIQWPNGASYEGAWEEGERTGLGRYTFVDGQQSIGRFVLGKLEDGYWVSAAGVRTNVGTGNTFTPPTYEPWVGTLQTEASIYSSLPTALAINKPGSGGQQIALFIDLDGFSRQAVATSTRMPDVTVQIFLVPLFDLGQEGRNLRLQLWCAEDRVSALREWASTGKSTAVPRDGCVYPQDELSKMMKKVKVLGTPQWLLVNGSTVSGAIPEPKLREQLASVRP